MDKRVMTDTELEGLGDVEDFIPIYGGDYTYRGRPVCVFRKRSGMIRCVVEDALGRLFIHSARAALLAAQRFKANTPEKLTELQR